MNKKTEWISRGRVVNWLALIVLLSLGIVWPPAFSREAAGGLANPHASSLRLKADPDGTRPPSRLTATRTPRLTLVPC